MDTIVKKLEALSKTLRQDVFARSIISEAIREIEDMKKEIRLLEDVLDENVARFESLRESLA